MNFQLNSIYFNEPSSEGAMSLLPLVVPIVFSFVISGLGFITHNLERIYFMKLIKDIFGRYVVEKVTSEELE